ncbi:MAG: hypothetical protein WDZ30_09455 [Cellvibrionaceae bacterium]
MNRNLPKVAKNKNLVNPRDIMARAVLGLCLLPLIAAAADGEWQVPKTSFGHPDLQGVWTNATMTPFERPSQYGEQLVLTPELGKQMEENNPFERMKAMDSRPTDPDAPPPTAGQGVGGYNVFWMDPGTRVVQVNGEYRTSIISSPKDGQVPYSEQGRKAFTETYGRRSSQVGFDGPEIRGLGERCLVGFGSTGGPPMLPVLYNNHYQIVQTPDHVMIMVEMNHDARIIRLDDAHRPAAMKPWLGDSVGHWEGDTLVVETINFHPGQTVRAATRHRLYVPATAKITERFTRTGPDSILYQFTVEDEEAYTQPWTGEMPMYATDKHIYEYACHEGNHSLPGILGGARQEEREGKRE